MICNLLGHKRHTEEAFFTKDHLLESTWICARCGTMGKSSHSVQPPEVIAFWNLVDENKALKDYIRSLRAEK